MTIQPIFKNKNTVIFKVSNAILLVALLLLGTACDNDEEKKPGQVAAKVGDTEITISLLNAELARLNIPAITDPKMADTINAGVLNNLVDQQLFVAQAKENGMERNPDVVQSIELAKHQILVQAYTRRLVSSLGAPDAKAVADYYDAHPELFKSRKIYTLSLLEVPKPEGKPEFIKTLEEIDTMADAKAYLKSQDLTYKQNMLTSPAEDLPMGVVAKMASADAGQLFMMNLATTVALYEIVSTLDEPLTLEQAKPLISQFLASQAKEKRVSDEVARLRKMATIEYVGKFSDLMAGVAVNPVESATDDKVSTDPQSVERGLSGLR